MMEGLMRDEFIYIGEDVFNHQCLKKTEVIHSNRSQLHSSSLPVNKT